MRATKIQPQTPPPWVRPREASRLSGIGKTTIHRLIKDNALISRLICKPGATHGIRVISYSSLMSFIEGHN